jgi:hypothetical protein
MRLKRTSLRFGSLESCSPRRLAANPLCGFQLATSAYDISRYFSMFNFVIIN